jgi:hypothetical protein
MLLSSVAGLCRRTVARSSSNALTGSGASIGGVEEMSKTKIPAAKTYKLA